MSRAKTHRPKTRGGTNNEGKQPRPRLDSSIPFGEIEDAIDALDGLEAPATPRTKPPAPPPKASKAEDGEAKVDTSSERRTRSDAVIDKPAKAAPKPPPPKPAPLPPAPLPPAPIPPAPKANIPFPPKNATPAPLPVPKPAPLPPIETAADELVVDVEDLPELRPLDVAIYETGAHLAPARSQVTATGNTVMIATSGITGVDQVKQTLLGGGVDVLFVTIPGGESLIEIAHELVRPPILIAICHGPATEAVRRAAGCGADLATLRPHDADRLALILLAAGRLLDERHTALTAVAAETKLRQQVGLPPRVPVPRPPPEPFAPDEDPEDDELDEQNPAADQEAELDDGGFDALDSLDSLEELDDDQPHGAAMQPFELFQQELDSELDRARRDSRSIALALFAVELDTKSPPPGIPGILRARAGTALISAIRRTDIATELDHERFLVLMPETDLAGAAEIARAVIAAVAEAPALTAAGRRFAPRVIGAVASAPPGQPLAFAKMMREVSQALEQGRRDGAELAVPISGSSGRESPGRTGAGRGDSMDAELDDVLDDIPITDEDDES
ncbi:MAG: diguanylate cyclase [Kofleriaceae bacterium]